MPDISAALTLLKKPLEALAGMASGEAANIVARLGAENSVKRLYGKLSSTQKVKTIWNVDRAISLSSFYYPAKIRTEQNQTQTINGIDEFPGNAIVISGTVGQGKSILLRHLLSKEIRSGSRVPLLVELRRTPPSGLGKYIRHSFDELMEISGHPEIFDLFAINGRVSIFLDGLDEVDPDRVQEIINDIESIAGKYPHSRIIVTARPNSAIESSSLFDVVHLAPLSKYDLQAFFAKILSRDKALALRIVTAIHESQLNISALTSTPLLATLLTVVYRANQKIPADFADFYDELFQILLIRHDRSKAGYERKRKTKLSDREIQQVFEAFCFKSRNEGTSSLRQYRALELAQESIKAQGVTCSDSDFISDVVKVTCLLQEEGGRIEFLHQSVQEFFAARYIRSRPEDLAAKFYGLVLSRASWNTWDQVLRFLSQIDKFRASKYFFIPALTQALTYLESEMKTAENSVLARKVSDIISVRQLPNQGDSSNVPLRYVVFPSGGDIYRMNGIHAQIFNLLFTSRPGKPTKWMQCFDGKTPGQSLTYTEIAARCGLGDELSELLADAVNAIRVDRSKHEAMVAQVISSGDFMGI